MATALARQLTRWRCASCNALLLLHDLAPGSVLTIKCRRCGTLNVLEAPVP